MHYLYSLIDYLSDIETLLITLILLFLLLAFILFTVIMVYRSIKIADLNYISSLKEQYDEVFMNAAFAEPDSIKEYIQQAKQLNQKHLQNKRHARIITNELINLSNSFSGESKDNLREIYMNAGFREYSENKIKSYKWELAAQGIREIAAMKNKHNTQQIKKLSKSKSKLVVENVQLSLVKVSGFKGLDFLNETEEPISHWQQINLIEALKEYSNAPLPDFAIWLSSKEKTVILFAVRLIRYFKKIDSSEKLLPLLENKNSKIKREAIQTLSEFGSSAALDKLIQNYSREPHLIQIEIIKAYALLTSSDSIETLLQWIRRTGDMEIKKTCIDAIIDLNALDKFKLMCLNDTDLYSRIKPFIDLQAK